MIYFLLGFLLSTLFTPRAAVRDFLRKLLKGGLRK